MTATAFTPPSGPRGQIRPGDSGSTLLGVFGEQPVARVDRGGAIQLLSASWTLDFWIAAEDRLHTPASEAAVRQSRLGAGPVVQTAVRIPGGDLIQRCWASRHPGGSAVVVEFENDTATPVGLALAIRPYDLAGSASEPSVEIHADRIDADQTTLWLSSERRDLVPEPDAAIVPLPHRATLRVVMIDASVGPTPDRPLPSADEAISGWDTLIARDSRVVLPDDRMTALFDQSRGRLSLSTHDLASRISAVEAGAGDELAALCHGGMAREAIEVLRSLLTDLWVPPRRKRNTPAEPQAAVIDGIGWACAMYAPQWAEEFLPAAIQIAQSSAKRGSPAAAARAHSALARISAISGDHQAAASIDRSSGYGPWDEPATVASISERLQQASETGSWREDDATPAARALSDLRSLLVREDSIDGAPEIDLFPNFASAWRGGSVELHSIETAFGSVSAALRWHGYRPALLWEFERAEHVMVPVRVRCRALDPDWSSTDRKGDALLAGVAEDLGEAPEEGQSFI